MKIKQGMVIEKSKSMKRLFNFSLLLLSFGFGIKNYAQAQTENQVTRQINKSIEGLTDGTKLGMSLMYVSPDGQFAQYMQNKAGGINFEMFWQAYKPWIKFGFDISYIMYGYYRDRSH